MSATDAAPPSSRDARERRLRLTPLLRALGPLLGLIVVWCVFAGLKGEDFTKWHTQRLMLLQTVVVGTAALGATFVIISGGIDLSVGSSVALGTVVLALLVNAGAPPWLCALGCVGTGLACGAVIGSMIIGYTNRVVALIGGFLVFALVPWSWPIALPAALVVAAFLLVLGERFIGSLPLSPFIVTLAMLGALRGIAKGLGDNEPVYPDHRSWLNESMAPGEGVFSILPPGVWVFLLLALTLAFALRMTRFGRHVFAIGSNENTARLCGIDVNRTKLLIYVVAVGCAGLAAVFEYGFLRYGDPTTAKGMELEVIAAVVIGGASLQGGEGSILGTCVGALIMTVVNTGCTKLNLDDWIQEIVTGAIIVTAVVIDRLRHRGAEARGNG